MSNSTSLKNKVTAFWEWFSFNSDDFFQIIKNQQKGQVAYEIKKQLDKFGLPPIRKKTYKENITTTLISQNTQDKIIETKQSLLQDIYQNNTTSFSLPFFLELRPSTNQCSLTLLSYNNPNYLFLFHYWKDLAPSISNWIFWDSFPPEDPYILKQRTWISSQKTYEAQSFLVYIELNHQTQKVNIILYHPFFLYNSALLSWNITMKVLFYSIGKSGIDMYLEKISTCKSQQDQQGLHLWELYSYLCDIKQKYSKWINFGLSSEKQWDDYNNIPADLDYYPPRTDIFVGKTACLSLQRLMINKQNKPSNFSTSISRQIFHECGAIYCFLQIPPIPAVELTELSYQIDKSFREAKVGYLIGEAQGRQNSYLDFILFDLQASKIILQKFQIFSQKLLEF